MQSLNYYYKPYAAFSSTSQSPREDIITPPECYIQYHFSEKHELHRRIQFLQQRCQYLEVENQQLRAKVEQDQKLTIKIEVQEPRETDEKQDYSSQQLTTPKTKKVEKPPKKRRTESELVKNFKCPYEGCRKDYASALALNLHMRVKHGGGTKKERKQLLRDIIDAELMGKTMPSINLNLPPNYLEEKKKLLLCCEDFDKLGLIPADK